MANAHHSKEKYLQIAAKMRGQKRTQATKDNISRALMGHKHNPETLAKMRRPRSEKGKANISKAMLGKIPWNKGRTGIYSAQTIEKLRQANIGKKIPDEVKEKLRNSMFDFFKSKNPNYCPPPYELRANHRKNESVRRFRIKQNGGSHTNIQWEHLKAAFNFQCRMCGAKEPEIKLTKDHIISIKDGGTDDISNIQTLCRSCNSKKR